MDTSSRERPSRQVRVYLVIENRLLREALVRFFRKQADICVVGQQQPRETTSPEIVASGSDVLLLDFLAAASTKNTLAELAVAQSSAKVLLFGMEEDPQCSLNAVRLGISAYLLNASLEELVFAVRNKGRGGVAIMKSRFDILEKIDEVNFRWLEAAQDLQSAKSRIEERQVLSPGEYVVFDSGNQQIVAKFS